MTFNSKVTILNHDVQTLDHPNIIKLFEVFYNEDDAHLVQEYTNGDDLYSRSPYSERDAARISAQLASAVAHMVRSSYGKQQPTFTATLEHLS